MTPATLSDFMTALSSTPHSHAISFAEFRDFLLLLPRKASTEEIYRYYQVRKFMGDDGRGAARVTMEGKEIVSNTVHSLIILAGDVSLSAEDRPPIRPPHAHPQPHRQTLVDHPSEGDGDDEGSCD